MITIKFKLLDIHRTFHSITREYTFFSSIHRLENVGNQIQTKGNSNAFQKIDITYSQNAIKLEITKNINKRIIFLTNSWVKRRNNN